jgi:hypothetical protein
MARLFITPREVDLISDITKEIMKDVVGQKIYYYRVREEYSEVHDVYEESPEKVFDPPIEIDALIEWDSSKVSQPINLELRNTKNNRIYSASGYDA